MLDHGIGRWRGGAALIRPRGSHGVRKMFVVVAKHAFVLILVHVTATAETKAEVEGSIFGGDSRGVGRCHRGLVEDFERVDYAWDCDL